MALATAKQASITALTATTTTTLYGPVAASTKFLLSSIVLCNTDTANRTVTMQWGSGTAVANRFLSALTLLAGETKIIDFAKPPTLITGDSITGGSDSGSVVSCAIFGAEVV